MQLKQGSLLKAGKYKIDRVLGQGGFGITYLAEQRITVKGEIGEMETRVKVAIKEFFMKDLCNRDTDTSYVSIPSIGSKELVQRFRQKFIKEARNISELKHQHIVKVLDVFEENGTAYYVMEFVREGSLSDYVKQQGKLSETEALFYICQVASALDYVHQRNINHLDVKPSNILRRDNAETVLIDFGLAKRYDKEGEQTSSTPVGVSAGYAPMEQYKRGGVGVFSPSTDVYSLGATLYYLVTGKTPPDANDIFDDGVPPLPSALSDSTKQAIEQAMQPSRKARPQSVEEFLSILKGAAAVVDVEEEDDDDYEDEATKVGTKDYERTVLSFEEDDDAEQNSDDKGGSKLPYILGGFAVVAVLVALFTMLGGNDSSGQDDDVVAQEVVVDDESQPDYSESTTQSEPSDAEENDAQAEQDRQAAERARIAAQKQRLAEQQAAQAAAAQAAQEQQASQQQQTTQSQTAQQNNQSFLSAQYQMGENYYYGKNGKTQSYADAIKWYRKAADKGYAPAQYDLGYCYKNGKGVTTNYSEAAKWYLKAANQGYTNAYVAIGYCYSNGKGVTQNYTEAVKWYRKAANAGDATGQNNLGERYYYGQGVSQSYSQAISWYRKAAAQGNSNSQYSLGYCYENGQGVTANQTQAVEWYRKAAASGDQNAKDALIRLGL